VVRSAYYVIPMIKRMQPVLYRIEVRKMALNYQPEIEPSALLVDSITIADFGIVRAPQHLVSIR